MIRILTASLLCCTLGIGAAHAQSQIVPFAPGTVLTAAALNTMQQGKADLSGLTAEIQRATEAEAGLVLRQGGASTNQTLTAPSISGGSATATDLSTSLVTTANAITSRTVAAHFADTIYVRDYGVKCDGATDDAAALTALAGSMIMSKRIVFPYGICVIKSPLSLVLVNARLEGAGSLATTILYEGASTTADIITIGSGTFASSIAGLDVQSTTTMTSGSGWHIKQARYSALWDVSATLYYATPNNGNPQNTLWNGIWVDEPDMVQLIGGRIEAQNDGFRSSALGVGTGFQYDIFMGHYKIDSSAIGVHVGGGIDNVHFDNMEVTSNTNNVVDDNAIEPYKNQEIFFGKNFVTDQGGQWNYYINDADCNTTNYGIVSISGPITAAKTYDNVYVKNFPACDLIIDSPFVTSAARDGVRVADASANVSISPATYVVNNGEYGINSEFSAYSGLKSAPVMFGNSSGNLAPTVVPPSVSSSAIPQYLLASLPVCSVTRQLGAEVYVTDGLKPGESSGSGSGVPAYCSLTAKGATTYRWVSAYSGNAVAN